MLKAAAAAAGVSVCVEQWKMVCALGYWHSSLLFHYLILEEILMELANRLRLLFPFPPSEYIYKWN